MVTSTKASNLAKQAVGATIVLTIIVKKKQLEKYSTRAKTNKKCFNCKKKSHSVRDYHTQNLNKRKPEESSEEVKRAQ